jgi:S1-C subfamily serine protease
MTSIEDLTKTQIILLTLLLSFVTSIATGIITTSLLAEAPQSFTQTINRVVERTIEKATPAPAPIKLTDEAKAAVAVLEKATEATVHIGALNADKSIVPVAIGVIASKDGIIVASNSSIKNDAQYVATLSDNSVIPLVLINVDTDSDVAIFRMPIAATTTPAQ